jgi:hypothetical protein
MGFVYFLIGMAVASVGWYFVARNNKHKVIKLLNLNPRAKWGEVLDKIKEKI